MYKAETCTFRIPSIVSEQCPSDSMVIPWGDIIQILRGIHEFYKLDMISEEIINTLVDSGWVEDVMRAGIRSIGGKESW
jgi:hypothetical protein